MQNLVWAISVYQQMDAGGGAGQLKYFLEKGEERTLKIGSSPLQDIFIHRGFPYHATIGVTADSFVVKARRKTICKSIGKGRILTRGEEIAVPLESIEEMGEDITVSLKIKDAVIKSTLRRDEDTLARWPRLFEFFQQRGDSLVKIAEGRTSLVYKISDTRVVKILKPEYVREKSFVGGFLNFAEMCRTLAILPVHETIVDKDLGLYACVMDYFPGETLYQLVVRHKRTADELREKIVEKLVKFVRRLHADQRVHRNLTPHNVLVNIEGECKVVGLSMVASPEKEMVTELSDMEMPTVNEDTLVPQDADIFSLGTLLYFLLTGREPFAEIAPHEYLLSQLPLLKFPEAAAPYKDLILGCIGHKESERIESVEELWQVFQNISQSRFSSATIEESSDMLRISPDPGPKVIDDKETQLDSEPKTREQSVSEAEAVPISELQRFDKFVLKEKKGEGRQAAVYHAVDTTTNRQVTLKILKSNVIPESDINRILQDTQAASALEHENILRVCEIGEAGGTYYITSEYLDGCNLKEYLEENLLSSEQILILVRDLARAVQYAHAKGVLHRNIKPSNILLTKKGKPYLTDFGLPIEVYTRKNSRDPYIVEARSYIAPELFKRPAFSPVQDVYSLGAILKKLTRHQSGMSKNDLRLPQVKNLTTLIPRPSKVAKDVQAIYMRATEYHSRHRYPNAIAFADDIDRFLEYRPVRATYPNFALRLWKLLWRDPFIPIASAFIIILGMYLWWLPAEESRPTDAIRKKAEKIYRRHHQQYIEALERVSLASPPLGQTPESAAVQKKVSRDLIDKIRNRYRHALKSEVVPLLRRCSELGHREEDEQRLREILDKIESLHSDDGELLVTGTATVAIAAYPPDAVIHLFRFREEQDGSKIPLPFSLADGKIVELTDLEHRLTRGRRQFILAQNLLWKAIRDMANRHFANAKDKLSQAIAIRADYIDAYFAMCCVIARSSPKKARDEECLKWLEKGRECILRSSVDDRAKKVLLKKFSPRFVGRIEELYSLVLTGESFDHLLHITSLPQMDTPFENGDILYQVDSKRISSRQELSASLHDKEKVTCLVLRHYRPRPLVVNADFYRDPKFCTSEQIPVFFVWHNRPLEFSNASIYLLPKTSKNRIKPSPVELPPGDYLLTVDHKNYIPLRYPFRIEETRDMAIKANMLRRIAEAEDFLSQFVFVAGDFVVAESEKRQNSKGFLISRYETTILDWGRYLRAANGKGPWDIGKIRNWIPVNSSAEPLFHLYKGKLELRRGNTSWPVAGIDPSQVEDYLAWYNSKIPEILRQKGVKVRLPSEEEWRVAAGGSDGRAYPWGDYANPMLAKILSARVYRSGCERIARYNPSFLCDESPFGVNDMAGSVAEYVTTGAGAYAVKGGFWSSPTPVDISTTWYSLHAVPIDARGFRLCIGVDPLME